MSMLECLGVSTVAINKETNTNEVMVTLPLDFPSQDGENVAVAEEVKTVYGTTQGDTENKRVLVGNTVPATWLNINSNRVTSPDVRIGTKVVLYQFKNSNKYYWTLYGLNGSMRLETIIYVISASPNINENTPINSDNFYIFSISSHKKKIEFISGQGNGEALGFQMTLDLANGWLGTLDSLGNVLCLNGVERSFTYLNKDRTQFSINKKDVTLHNLGDTLIKSKNIFLMADEKLGLKGKEGGMDIESMFTMKAQNVEVTKSLKVGQSIESPSMMVNGCEMDGHDHGGVERGEQRTDKLKPSFKNASVDTVSESQPFSF